MKLKPCPFCGDDKQIMLRDRLLYFRKCYCGGQGPSHITRLEADNAWNTRATAPETPEPEEPQSD